MERCQVIGPLDSSRLVSFEMLIWLDGDVAAYEAAIAHGLADALIELGEAGYKARHVVACSRAVAKLLADRPELSGRARAYFGRIYGEFTQLGGVLATKKHLSVSPEVAAPIVVGDTWRLPLQMFNVEDFTNQLVVVCENDTDFEVYVELARRWMRYFRPDCVVSAVSRAGGGGSTVTVIRRLMSEPNPPFLCIVDSDREVVLGAIGSTAKSVKNIWSDTWRGSLFVLDCRELENALPVELVLACQREFGFEDLATLELSNVHADLREYACLKSGESLCRFHKVPRSHAGYARTMSALENTSRTHRSFGICGRECAEAECKVIPSLGEGFLPRFSEWLQSKSRQSFQQPVDWPVTILAAVETLSTLAMALPRRH